MERVNKMSLGKFIHRVVSSFHHWVVPRKWVHVNKNEYVIVVIDGLNDWVYGRNGGQLVHVSSLAPPWLKILI